MNKYGSFDAYIRFVENLDKPAALAPCVRRPGVIRVPRAHPDEGWGAVDVGVIIQLRVRRKRRAKTVSGAYTEGKREVVLAWGEW